MTARTWLLDIPEEKCRDLLASSVLGRVAVIVAGRPEIFPVNHVYDRSSGSIMLPTNPGTKLHAALDWPWTAFEVDGLDPDGAGGWSVLVVGRAEEVTDPDDIARVVARRHARWRAGDQMHWLRIVPSKVTGRRISVTDG
jgi:uncharacterized protein